MTGYTENEIRAAIAGMGTFVPATYAESLLTRLRKPDMHAIWTDSDTVTVKEFREAYAAASGEIFDDSSLLRYIAEHREPEYYPGTIWEDSGKPPVPWYRTGNGMWLRFGHAGEYSHNYPVRPLKRMDVI